MSIGETSKTKLKHFFLCSVIGKHQVSYEREPCVFTLESAECDFLSFRAADVSDRTILLTGGVKGGARDNPLGGPTFYLVNHLGGKLRSPWGRQTQTYTSHLLNFYGILQILD